MITSYYACTEYRTISVVRIKWDRKVTLHTWYSRWDNKAVSDGKGLLNAAKMEHAYLAIRACDNI